MVIFIFDTNLMSVAVNGLNSGAKDNTKLNWKRLAAASLIHEHNCPAILDFVLIFLETTGLIAEPLD